MTITAAARPIAEFVGEPDRDVAAEGVADDNGRPGLEAPAARAVSSRLTTNWRKS